MKSMKVFLYSTAAGIAAMSSAQAADLPVKAKPVEYVRICSLYGAGFYYIPGTDTCLKIGGRLVADLTIHGNLFDGPAWSNNNGANDRFAHDFNTRARLTFQVDTRTATQYGVVRTFGQADYQFSTYGAVGSINTALVNGSAGTGGVNNDTPGNGYVAVAQVFLQFAGFTFGKSFSARSVPWHGYAANNATFAFIGGPDYVTGVNNIQYTYQWGNGITTTIGVDEPVVFNRTNLGNVLAGSTATAAAGGSAVPFLGNIGGGGSIGGYAGQSLPDIVGNFKIDQAWGIFTVAGGIHEVKAAYYNNSVAGPAGTLLGELSGHPGTKIGGSVTAGVQINNVPTGVADRFTVDGTYAVGDTRTVIGTSFGSPSFQIFGKGNGATYQSVGFGFTNDGIYSGTNNANGTSIQLTRAYGARAAFIHNWTPEWQSSLFGSYSRVDYNGTATALYCAQYGRAVAGLSTTYTCNPDFSVYQAGFRTGWTPVPGLTFSSEVLYVRLDQRYTGQTGAAVTPSATLAKPPALYNFADQETVSVNFRAVRNF